ncbi:short chain dehydrogenase [Arthrobacter sp. cf158]|uniref:SDR family oxidoreductase n=1 Tax=Arthrobacter sp. cf158 TaxID=1761744 RepID=UPI0008992CAF|nr:SDR family oxidoreductase [Arthrobacter sp. cf158]SDW86493.1 short chain dehydrogenase [Arthrobacter sp. cf158]
MTVVYDVNSAEDAPAAAGAAVDTFGSIINVPSLSGKVGTTRQTTYSRREGGIIDLTKMVAEELAFAGIRLNADQPDIIRTELVDSLRPNVLEEKLSEFPLTRFNEPDEVASVVLCLTSYMTGTVLAITGGRHA